MGPAGRGHSRTADFRAPPTLCPPTFTRFQNHVCSHCPLPFTQCNDFWKFHSGVCAGATEPSCSDGHLLAQVTNRSPTREGAVTTLETNLAGGSPGCSLDPSQVPGEMHPAHENSTLTPPYVSGFERRLPALLIPRGCHTGIPAGSGARRVIKALC